jgi:uncharacterized membrane protein YfcA
MDFLILGLAAFLAGFVDAVVGGGGLIQLPALFSVLPNTMPATLLGTSKLAGIWGTSVAAVNYMKAVRIQWSVVLPSSLAAFICSFAGAFTVTHLPPTYLRTALPFILAAVAVYTFMRKDLGTLHKPVFTGDKERSIAMLIAAGIGFYDGFFGPGTGSFFIFLFVHFLGYDFLRASAVAKVLNVACNAAALLWFGYSGHIIWQVGLAMAVCGIAGSIAGSRLAIRNGSGFVRQMFLVVVTCLILKTAYDAFLK